MLWHRSQGGPQPASPEFPQCRYRLACRQKACVGCSQARSTLLPRISVSSTSSLACCIWLPSSHTRTAGAKGADAPGAARGRAMRNAHSRARRVSRAVRARYSSKPIIGAESRCVGFDGHTRRQIVLEDLEDSPVLIRPRGRPDEAVILHRINRQLPVGLAQFYQFLGQSHDVLK